VPGSKIGGGGGWCVEVRRNVGGGLRLVPIKGEGPRVKSQVGDGRRVE
jgi:hypothetical protein